MRLALLGWTGEGARPHMGFASYEHPSLHTVVIRPSAAFRGYPRYDLVWIGDVAGFAVDAIRWVQADAFAVGLARVVDHFVDVRRTEILARAAEFFHTPRVADVRVVDYQMRRLVFFMLGTGVIEIGKFVEREFAVAFGGSKQVRFGPSIREQLRQLTHVLVSGFRRISIAQAPSAGDHLQSRVKHARIHSPLKPLMQVAHLPQFFFDPAGFNLFLEST